MKKSNYLFLSLLLFAVTPCYLFAQQILEFADSEQRYVYDVSYKKIAIGKIIRESLWQGNTVIANTTAELSFLSYHFGGNQLSHIYWDEMSQSFLSKTFVRNSVGFSRVSMQANFFKAGHQTSVTRDGKTDEYVNETEKIIDFNAIGVQMSEGLKLGQTHFEFYMQTSDSVERYFFEVTGKEAIHTKFGKLDTYRLEQTGKKDRKLIAWFAPEINYQMVKFRYERNLLDIRGVISERSIINL